MVPFSRKRFRLSFRLMEELTELLGQMVLPRRMERILRVLDSRFSRVRAVAENLHHRHNMSALLRSCEALGVQHVHAVEKYESFSLSRKVTMGSHKWLTLHRYQDFAACADELKSQGFSIFAAMLSDRAMPVGEIPVDRPVALVFGNELMGVSPEALSRCDGEFVIPMSGFVQSFNVSVAAAVSLYDVTTRMSAAHPGECFLTPEEKASLLSEWLPKSAPFAKRIAKIMRERTQGLPTEEP